MTSPDDEPSRPMIQIEQPRIEIKTMSNRDEATLNQVNQKIAGQKFKVFTSEGRRKIVTPKHLRSLFQISQTRQTQETPEFSPDLRKNVNSHRESPQDNNSLRETPNFTNNSFDDSLNE